MATSYNQHGMIAISRTGQSPESLLASHLNPSDPAKRRMDFSAKLMCAPQAAGSPDLHDTAALQAGLPPMLCGSMWRQEQACNLKSKPTISSSI